MQILKELLRDPGDGDIIDIQLIPLNEEKEEIQRPLKLRQLDPVHATPASQPSFIALWTSAMVI